MTIHDFVNKMCLDYPSLIDYLGFYEEEMELETSAKTIYDPHLEVEALTQGIKQGEFLQGKISMDRNCPEEGQFLDFFDL